MAPGSTAGAPHAQKQQTYLVVHEALEQVKVVGSYSTEEEAYCAALHKQMGVFRAIKEFIERQVLVDHQASLTGGSLEWKLRMLQDAMESYFLDVGFEPLADYFTVSIVTDHHHANMVTDGTCTTTTAPRKRKMGAPREDHSTKLAKSNTSCGVASTTSATLRTMARYMYQTSPFGMSV